MQLNVLRVTVVLPLLFGVHFAHGQTAASFDTAVKPLLANYCIDCHGPDDQQAGLRLDTLSADSTDSQSLAVWTRVHDRVQAGEMPPADADQPDKGASDAAARWLRQSLHAASLDQQRKQGRVVLRRLNATEYENTIHDLLLTSIPLKELLPDDNSASGFDNVSAVLDVSAAHQLVYQEAAEKAIASVVPLHPPLPFHDRRTGREMSEKGPNFRQTLGRSCLLQGDSLIFYSRLPRYGLCSSAPVPTAGRYRVRMSIGAVGEQKAVPAGFMTVERSGRELPVLRELRDIPAGKPQVIELEFDLNRHQSFVVNLLTTWDIRGFKRPIEEYDGPGLLVEWIEVEGPIEPFPPERYERLFAGVPLKPRSVAAAETAGRPAPRIPETRSEYSWLADPLVPASDDPKRDAERLIRDFLPRAFRRPVSEELQRHFVQRVHDQLDQQATFHEAMTYGYKSILSSPHFLLFLEPGSAASEAGELRTSRLDDFAVANRLSYFLWSTGPDEELWQLAEQKALSRPDVLRGQVERMLDAPQARRFTENFTGQWLDLRKISETIPDPQLYPDSDDLLLAAMPRETHRFFEEILRHDRSLLEFVDSDWTMLNERLALHYGIEGVDGNEFRKVKLPPDSHRGGVVTHASVLKVTADGTQTSPILRGTWVLERIIGQPPSPPPPDIPVIEPDIRGATTIRQQLDKHRNIAVCASCHVHIDPPGFALESFDPIGGYRTFYRASTRTPAGPVALPQHTSRPVYRGLDVDATGETHDGHQFAGIDDYKKLLLADPDPLARNLTEKLLIYATGAEIQFADREVVEKIVATLHERNYGFRTLVHEVVQSRIFLNK